MLQRRMNLIFEFVPIDRAATSPCASRISCLDHEVRNDPVKDDLVVVSSLRQTCKVVARLGCVVVVEL